MLKQSLSLCRKTARSLKNEGLPQTLRKISRFLQHQMLSRQAFKAQILFDFLIEKNRTHKKTVIIGPTMLWDHPMFQRPQQLALAFAREGAFVVYLEQTPQYADYRNISGDLYVLAAPDFSRLLDSISGATILIPQGLYWNERRAELSKLAEVNCVVFEYLDHIDEKISGPQGAADLKDFLCFLKDEEPRVHLLTTSRALRAELAESRAREEVLLSPNGVDTRHFTRRGALPDDRAFAGIVAKNKPIIGYYGALAPWLDYSLLNAVMRQCPEYEFVFIGINYRGGAQRLDVSLPHCSWLGPRKYELLPAYASRFNAALIPFERGEIARSTSPLKLFEYFALGLPVVVTADMEECKGFEEVLCAGDAHEFTACLEKALKLGEDVSFTQKLLARAAENTWDARAREINAFVARRYKNYVDLHNVQKSIMEANAATGGASYYNTDYLHFELGYWYPAVDWLAGLRDIGSILDIGGAYGTLLSYAGAALNVPRKVLFDKVLACAPGCNSRFGLEVHHVDVETEDFTRFGRFDLIIFTEVLEHFNYAPIPTLRKIRNALSENGYLLLSTPDARTWGRLASPYKDLAEIPEYQGQKQPWIDGHIWQYTKQELDAVISKTGFQVERFARSQGYKGMQHLCYLLRKN